MAGTWLYPNCINNMAKYIQYRCDSAIFWIFHQVNSKDGIYFAMLFTLAGKPENFRSLPATPQAWLLRVRSKKTTTSPSDALTLKPSGFCNTGVKTGRTFLAEPEPAFVDTRRDGSVIVNQALFRFKPLTNNSGQTKFS